MSSDEKNNSGTSEGANLDTGLGGFRGPDGKIYFYDPLTGEKSVSGRFSVSEKKIHVDFDSDPNRDLSSKTKNTLKDYLVNLSKKSYYNLDGENSKEVGIQEFQHVTSKDEGFLPLDRAIDAGFKSRSSVIENPDEGTSLSNKIVIGGGPNSADPDRGTFNGNDLLKDPSPPVGEYVNVVLKNNRFTSGDYKTFFKDSVQEKKDFEERKMFLPSSDEGSLGRNLLKSDGTSTTFDRLKSVGAVLSLKSSGEFLGKNDPNGPNALLASVTPGAQQLSWWPISSDDDKFDVRKIEKELDKDASTQEIFVNRTWGTMNNVNESFQSLGMAITSYALLAIIAVVVRILANLFSYLIAKPVQSHELIPGKHESYKYSSETWQKVFKYFFPVMNPHSEHSFIDCFDEGMQSFFKVGLVGPKWFKVPDPRDALDLEFLNNSGFTQTNAREMIKSTLMIFTGVADQWAAPATPMSVVSGVFNLVQLVQKSKIIKIINLFVSTGDRVMSAGNSDKLNLPYGDENKTESKSYIDTASYYDGKYKKALKDHLVSLVGGFEVVEPTIAIEAQMKSQIDSKGKRYYVQGNRKFITDNSDDPARVAKMSWSADATHVNLLSWSTTTDSGHKYLQLQKLNFSRRVLKVQNILFGNEPVSNGVASTIEKYLNSEYMPFYFRDMRTNEIVSFHAFLDSLTDGYSVSYDTHEGIGRVEPIRIYKSTQRKFGFSFYIVSTGPKDIHDMYEKINKLTTLVYPQYTRGKKIITADGVVYRQPFSQLVGASPMIRIKLGDIARSNYSRFDLARLFGFGNEGEALPPATKKVTKTAVGNNISYKDALNSKEDLLFVLVPGGEKQLQLGPGGGSTIHSSASGGKFAINDKVSIQGKTYPNYSDPRTQLKFKYDKSKKCYVNEELSYNWEGSSIKVDKGVYKVDLDHLQLVDKSKKIFEASMTKEGFVLTQDGQVFKKSVTTSTDEGTDFVDIFTPDSNAIVRNFENNAGSGLAGFIESLDFDWDVKLPWEVDEVKAPKMCKVTVSFSPIHDISPGIDHNGYNRAKIY